MAKTWTSRRLRNERDHDKAFISQQRQIARQIGVLIQRKSIADPNDSTKARIVPNTRKSRAELRDEAWRLVLKPYFIGAGDDPLVDMQPQSPYAQLIYDGIYNAVHIESQHQASLIKGMLRNDVVYQWLTGPRPAGIITEQRGTYDPFHEWVDPNGYRLSDRIWRAGTNTRVNINRFLDYHISRGTSAVDMADLLEDYLTPGARLIRTKTPYGKEGSYAARRLARTEITAAAGRATINESMANPFVRAIRWALSPTHGCCDVCDDNAVGGENGDGVYAIDDVPAYPAHPHCMCTLQPVTTESTVELVDRLRRGIDEQMQATFGRTMRPTISPPSIPRAGLPTIPSQPTPTPQTPSLLPSDASVGTEQDNPIAPAIATTSTTIASSRMPTLQSSHTFVSDDQRLASQMQGLFDPDYMTAMVITGEIDDVLHNLALLMILAPLLVDDEE
jgi:hypothetical protein